MPTMYERVRRLCNEHGIEISNLGDHLPDVSIAKSSISGWKKGATPRAGVVKSIADFFDVSTEYILNGDRNSSMNAERSSAGLTPIVIINGDKRKLTEQEAALLELYEELDVIQKARLLAYASEL